jgi:hypothetical protein
MSNNKDFFRQDLSRLNEELRKTALSVYDFCMNELKTELHYRTERVKKNGGGQKHTIFRIKKTRTFFLVIDMQKPDRLRLSFPDKEDEFSSWNAQWCSKRQGVNGKKEKNIDIFRSLTDEELKRLNDDIAVIYDNALRYYLRKHDSTKTLQLMFGEPSGSYPPLKAAALSEDELCEVYGEGKCSVCGRNDMLEIGWNDDGKPLLFCMEHNPQRSKFYLKAYNVIPVDVREYVWHRDKGHGVCGHDAYLQYDHLIPRKKGGSNTENNIVLKCRTCNLSKSDKLQP